MKIEAGKRYKTAGGFETSEIINDGPRVELLGIEFSGIVDCFFGMWNSEGLADMFSESEIGKGQNEPFNIVEEIEDV